MSDENVALAWRLFQEFWNYGHMEVVDELVAPDAIGHGEVQHSVDIGMKEFKAFVLSLREAFPDLHMSIQDTIAQDDKVVVRWTCSVTHLGSFLGMPATGRRASVTGISIFAFSEQKIVEGWHSWDQLGLLVQLGAVTPKEFVTVSEKRAANKS